MDVIYDPADVTELTIEYEGHKPWKAKELVIGKYVQDSARSCRNIWGGTGRIVSVVRGCGKEAQSTAGANKAGSLLQRSVEGGEW